MLLYLSIIDWYPSLRPTGPAACRGGTRDCKCTQSDSYIIELAKPKGAKKGGTFKGNHWFHMAEYYISRSQHFHLPQRVDLMIISSEYKMSNFISNMGLFLMIAAFTDGLPRRVQLFAHSPLQSIAGNIDSNHSVFFSQGPVLSYDSERMDFISGKTTSHCACICGTYAGRVGEYPIERGKWFQNNSAAVIEMRLRIGRFCSHIQVGLTTGQHNQFKIVIYQRDVNRRIIDLESALISLKNKLGFIAPNLLERINIFVIEHEEDRHPCALYRWLADADILLTAHGFQSTALLLMKPGAMLIEIFNFKYWKIGYQPLAIEYGLHHRWLQNSMPTSFTRLPLYFVSQKWCMINLRCRRFSRTDDIRLNNDDYIREIVSMIIEQSTTI